MICLYKKVHMVYLIYNRIESVRDMIIYSSALYEAVKSVETEHIKYFTTLTLQAARQT